MAKFMLTDSSHFEDDIICRLSIGLYIIYNRNKNEIYLLDPRYSKAVNKFFDYTTVEKMQILPAKTITNTKTGNTDLSPYYATGALYTHYGIPDVELAIQLFKILRISNWKWRKQFNDNISIFTSGFTSYASLIRTFIFLARCPGLILTVPELKTNKIIKSTSDIIRIDDFNGTNLNQIFKNNKEVLKVIKKTNNFKNFKIKYAIKMSKDYNWHIDKSIKIVDYFTSADFQITYNGGIYTEGNRYKLLDKLAVNYSYEKIYNYFNKLHLFSEKNEEYDINRSLKLILDAYNMLEELNLVNSSTKIPIIYLERAEQFHDIILEYYIKLTGTNDSNSRNFKVNVLKSSKYMDININEYTFVVLKSATALTEEGYKQSHCVGGYYNKVERGDSVIVSMRKITNIEKPVITIEAHTRGKNVIIYQKSGKSNRSPKKEENEIIEKWKNEATKNLVILSNKALKLSKNTNQLELDTILKLIKK